MRRRQDEATDAEGEPDPAPAFLALAREIQAETARIAADPSAQGELLAELIERVPDDQRMKLARTIFDALAPEQQWAILERLYGDDQLRSYLEAERDARVAQAHGEQARRKLAQDARAQRALDTHAVPRGEHLTLGLFREQDVRAALARGHASSVCARRLVLRALGDGTFQVVEDTFNPNGGYFVTAEYSEDTWREHDRLAGHTIVRVGSIIDGEAGATFEPVLYAGARVDFEVGGRLSHGRLNLGFAMLSDTDVFVQ